MAPKVREGDAVVAVSGKWISWAHTTVAYAAFIGALLTGLSLHYRKIVENEYYVPVHLVGSIQFLANSVEGVPSRVVSFSLRYNRRPLPGTCRLSILHRHDIRQAAISQNQSIGSSRPQALAFSSSSSGIS